MSEFATLGLACVLTRLLPVLEITEAHTPELSRRIIHRREGIFRWKVSGQQSGNLDNLRDAKAGQLLDNPFGKPGFVCVAVYDQLRSYLWFYEVADDPR